MAAPADATLTVRLTPRAGADRVDGVVAAPEGGKVLKVSVTAPPAEGRANEALLRLLAREWRLPRRDLALVSGAKSRDKLVHITGDGRTLADRLAALLAELPAR